MGVEIDVAGRGLVKGFVVTTQPDDNTHGQALELLMSVDRALAIAHKGMSFDIVRESGLFPSVQVLNSFFRCGIDDAASEVSLRWEPFALTESEYYVFHEACQNSFGKLRIDGLGFEEFSDWFAAVALRNTNE